MVDHYNKLFMKAPTYQEREVVKAVRICKGEDLGGLEYAGLGISYDWISGFWKLDVYSITTKGDRRLVEKRETRRVQAGMWVVVVPKNGTDLSNCYCVDYAMNNKSFLRKYQPAGQVDRYRRQGRILAVPNDTGDAVQVIGHGPRGGKVKQVCDESCWFTEDMNYHRRALSNEEMSAYELVS